MAVPKQKQSHARTSKRRAQHKISAPTFNACPQCHSPRRPHRVCPVCGTYAGREVVAPDAAHDHDHDH
jgi:large subunit ribosomal protein L32